MFCPSVTGVCFLVFSFCKGCHSHRLSGHNKYVSSFRDGRFYFVLHRSPSLSSSRDDFCHLCCSIAQDAMLFVIITDVLFLFFSLHRAPSLTSSVSSFHNGQFFHSEENVFQSSQIDGKFLRSEVHVLRSNSIDGIDYADDRRFGNSSDEDAGSSRQKF